MTSRHTQTDHVTPSVAMVRIYVIHAMWPNTRCRRNGT